MLINGMTAQSRHDRLNALWLTEKPFNTLRPKSRGRNHEQSAFRHRAPRCRLLKDCFGVVAQPAPDDAGALIVHALAENRCVRYSY